MEVQTEMDSTATAKESFPRISGFGVITSCAALFDFAHYTAFCFICQPPLPILILGELNILRFFAQFVFFDFAGGGLGQFAEDDIARTLESRQMPAAKCDNLIRSYIRAVF